MAVASRCSKSLKTNVPFYLYLMIFVFSGLTNAQIRYAIPEELESGAVVGDIVRDLGLDPRTLSTRRMRITSDSGRRYFTINHKSGKLLPRAPNADWRYSASLRAGGVMQSSVHMEESAVMQGAQGVLVQNWPTVSSAADGDGGEVSPPMGAGVDSNSWHFRYGPPGVPGGPPQHLKPGEVPPEAFIIPGSPAIISIRQNQGGEDDKSDFITFGKKEEAKKKKKKKKEKKDKKDKGKDDGDD
ncbi:unnamed protein product [Boreogadus saida]